jgi:DNA-binding LytR/AlgR family response regulator
MKMEILIVEDEKPAAERLIRMVSRHTQPVSVVARLGSVRDTVQWLTHRGEPDLMLLDIQLSDGSSLDIFRQCTVTCPVVFTTAYDEHILEAFQYNCIDYLLKPIHEEKLHAALGRYRTLRKHFTQEIASLLEDLSTTTHRYRRRITVKTGIEFLSIPTGHIAFFYTEHKLVFLVDRTGKKYLAERSMADLESMLDPSEFFRINRKILAHINAVDRFKSFDKGKLRVELKPHPTMDVVVSQERASSFKEWMDR